MSQSSAIAQYLQPFVDKNLIAGAVTIVASSDKIISFDTVGWADLAAKKPMAADNLFWIASMTKPMTGAAFMMLVDEGKINVDDPVEKYLPEFDIQMMVSEKDDNHIVLRKPTHKITVKEILTQTSGMPFCSHVELPSTDQLSLRHAVRSYAATPLVFPPGTQFGYANSNTNTAGRIIEVVSGMPYGDFMHERLFKPLGMKDTTFVPSGEKLQRLAKAYQPTADKSGLEEIGVVQLTYPLDNPQRTPIPGGGLFSTADDVLKFCRMILNKGVYEGKRYLSEKAVLEMTTKQTGEKIETGYGYCWGVEAEKFGHAGAYKTDLSIFPKHDLITVFLIHHNNEWPTEEGKSILSNFMAAAKKLVPTPIP